jgi:large subunit ribosomal protein L2
MALKHFNPTSPGRRQLVLVDRSELHKGRPEKALVEGLSKSGGRGGGGRIAVRFPRRRRQAPLSDHRFQAPQVRHARHGRAAGIRPNRSAFIALITYEDGEKAYILAPQRLKAGDQVVASERADVKPGNAMPLRGMPIGTIIHNVELKPLKGGQIARAAGAYAQLVGRDAGYAQIRLNSGELRMVQDSCMATVGAVSNPDHMNEVMGKAGRVRHKGRRPHVRGVAMNPVDHPHGGGEGKTSGGRHPVTPWGKPTKGSKTRTNKTTDKFIIRSRHARKAR